MSCGRKIALILGSIFLIFVLVVVIGIAILFSMFRHTEPVIRDHSVLALKIEGELPDYIPDTLQNRLFGGDKLSLTTLIEQLRKAKVDKRISGVLLDIKLLAAGWGKAEELRDAIADFRTSGKPIYAYIEVGTNKEYYIATAAERVYVMPTGDLFINGLAADVMFFRGSLDKLGVYPDVFQIGKYKNAPDEFTAMGVNWIAFDEPTAPVRAEVRVRYRHTAAVATITPLEDNHAHIIFDEPQRAITPGQATVFYRNDEVVGGGWIVKQG